jgi:hypothetical protein
LPSIAKKPFWLLTAEFYLEIAAVKRPNKTIKEDQLLTDGFYLLRFIRKNPANTLLFTLQLPIFEVVQNFKSIPS